MESHPEPTSTEGPLPDSSTTVIFLVSKEFKSATLPPLSDTAVPPHPPLGAGILVLIGDPPGQIVAWPSSMVTANGADTLVAPPDSDFLLSPAVQPALTTIATRPNIKNTKRALVILLYPLSSTPCANRNPAPGWAAPVRGSARHHTPPPVGPGNPCQPSRQYMTDEQRLMGPGHGKTLIVRHVFTTTRNRR